MTGRDTAPGSRTPDPVGELRYTVAIGGQSIGFFEEVTGIAVEYDVFTVEEGGENRFSHKLRGRAKYPNLVLKRGITHEKTLLSWFGADSKTVEVRDLAVSLMGPNGKPVRTWAFVNAIPVKWTGPSLKGGSNSIATEVLEIAYDAFKEQ